MLLNLSNHPSHKWTPEQQQAAREQYCDITDIPFPNIPPEATEEELGQLVEAYVEKIKGRQPAAVHLMGEMTFTYRLVQRLKEAGIPCVASTTHRIVEEKDGKKNRAISVCAI